MNELRVVRGSDVHLFADDTPLFGVTALSASQKNSYHEVYEYGSSVPSARIPQGTGYVLQLTMLTMFDRQFPREIGFCLKLMDGSDVYCYDGCRITERKTELKGNNSAVKVITIEADRMRKEALNERRV